MSSTKKNTGHNTPTQKKRKKAGGVVNNSKKGVVSKKPSSSKLMTNITGQTGNGRESPTFIANRGGAGDYESVDNNSTDEDYSDDGDEGAEGYKQGGYHPVSIGDRFNSGRYTVIEKLGWGHFSTVWMCYDKKAAAHHSSEFVALKIQKSAPHYREAAMDEIELLSCASAAAISEAVLDEFGPMYDPCMVLLLNHFDHQGPNGRHVCMSFEMLGENLLKVIKRYEYRGIPIPIVKNFVRQMCVGLDFLHRQCSIIHTDLKPENVLIATPPPVPSMEKMKKILAEPPMGSADGSMTNKSNVSSGKGKKKKKKSGNGGGTDMNISIETLQKALDNGGKGLTADERKKLKKKLKKKKQQVRKKNETKKNRRGGKGPRGVRKSSGSTDRFEKNDLRSSSAMAVEEMMLMEQDSIPLAMKGLGQRTSTELSTDMQLVNMSLSSLCLAEAKGGGEDRDPSHPSTSSLSMNYLGKSGANVGAKSLVGSMAKMTSTSSSTGGMMMMDDDEDEDDDLMMNDDDEDDDEGGEFEEDEVGVGDGDESLERDVTLQRGSNVPLGYKSTAGRLIEPGGTDDCGTLTAWLRPTLFAYLNFSGDEHVPGGNATGTGSDNGSTHYPYSSPPTKTERLIPIPMAHWPRPRHEDYARICLIAPMSRMTICFGEPNLDGDDDATADVEEDDPDHSDHPHGSDSMTTRFAQWYFALMSPPTDKVLSSASSSSSSSSSHGLQYGGGGTSNNNHHNNSPSTTQLASTMAVVVPSLSHGAGTGIGSGVGLGSTLSPGVTGTGTPIGNARELTGAGPRDEPLYFNIKGCGEDTTGISALVGYSVLNMLTQQPEVYSIRPPMARNDRPVLWHIEHEASSTETLIAFLERHMAGVHFLVHYDTPSMVKHHVLTEEDDADLLYISRSLCVHPLIGTGLDLDDDSEPLAALPLSPGRASLKGLSSSSSSFADANNKNSSIGTRIEAKNAEEKGISGSNSSSSQPQRKDIPLSGGCLLGVDIEALTRLVLVNVNDMDVDHGSLDHDNNHHGDGSSPGDSSCVPRPFFKDSMVLSKYVRPLERRLRHFRMTDREEIETVVEEFLLAASEAVDNSTRTEGHHGFLSDAEREAEIQQRVAHTAALEAEYLHAKVKIVDLGNACWTYKHFTDDIQTRQYRAPEVILDPQEGKTWDREEDHLAMMIELLGDFPRSVSGTGKFAGDYFNRKGELKHIHSLKYWGLADVLREKYKLSHTDSTDLADFLAPLLEVNPHKRASAGAALQHPWLRSSSCHDDHHHTNHNYHSSYNQNHHHLGNNSSSSSSHDAKADAKGSGSGGSSSMLLSQSKGSKRIEDKYDNHNANNRIAEGKSDAKDER